MRYVFSWIANDSSAFEIVNSVDFLQAITWTPDAWKEVTTDAIKNCFAKCGIAEQRVEVNDELDNEFEDVYKELTGELESKIIVEEFIHFDAGTNTCPHVLNSDKINWRITSIQGCISEYHGGLGKGGSDNEVIDVATDNDEEGSLLQVTPREGLRMLDQLVFVTGICEKDRRALFQ